MFLIHLYKRFHWMQASRMPVLHNFFTNERPWQSLSKTDLAIPELRAVDI